MLKERDLMWRLLIVALIALIPMGLSYAAEKTGVRAELESWLSHRTPVATLHWQERADLAEVPAR